MCSRGAWLRAEAIHNKECRASILALRRSASCRRFWEKKVIGLGDNLSEILSTSRGRARNWELNSLCRVAAAYIATGINWRRRHVVSAASPADYDSRLADRKIISPGEVLGPGALRRRLAQARVSDGAGVLRAPPDRDRMRDVQEAPVAAGVINPDTAERMTGAPALALAAPGWLPAAAQAGAHGTPHEGARYFLEVFAGSGRISAALDERGLLVAEPLDLNRGPWCDLLDKRVEKVVASWILSGRVWGAWFAPPCARCSPARTTGRAGSYVDISGIKCAHAMLRLLRVRDARGVRYVIENPARSSLFTWSPWRPTWPSSEPN